MWIATGRQIAIVAGTALLVGVSIFFWPVAEVRPEQQLAAAGAKLCMAHDETLLIGALMEGESIGDELVMVAAKVPSLQRLSLADSRVTRTGIQALQSLPKLQALDLSRTAMTRSSLELIAAFPQLHELRLNGCAWLRDEHLEQLIVLKNLEQLNVSETAISPAGFPFLQRFPKLKFLVLDRCPQITDESIEALIELCSSRRFSLSLSGTDVTAEGLARLRKALPDCIVHLRPDTMVGLREIGDRGQFVTNQRGEIWGFRRRTDFEGMVVPLYPGDLTVVGRVTNLVDLNLEQSNIDDEMLLELPQLPRLETLRLSATRITDASLKVLTRFPNLKTLWLFDNDIQGPGLENLRHLPLLTHLKVQARQGDEILTHLESLSALERLSIAAPLSNAAMERLSLLPVQHLALIETGVTAPGISHLATNTQLTELRFDGGLVSDAEIDALANLKGVKWIVLYQTRVTSAGRDRLIGLRPDMSVHWSGDSTIPAVGSDR